MTHTDLAAIRAQFPILQRQINGKPLIYLDNAATMQTPQAVVDAINEMYHTHKANVHRGIHTLSQEATDLLEQARDRVRQFIHAAETEEIVFTRGTTEAINLVAASLGQLMNTGDEVVVTEMEHHSNIVPYQLIGGGGKVRLKAARIHDDGTLDLDHLASLLTDRTRLVAVTHVSNVLGTVNPIADITALARQRGIPVLVDGAQAAAHLRIDVDALDCDFYTFSAHKMYGPQGVGVLYARKPWLHRLPPYQGGGEMIDHVDFQQTTFAHPPQKFEAGTPDFVGIAALTAAINFIEHIGIERINEHEQTLLAAAEQALQTIDGLRLFGNAPGKGAVLSFLVRNINSYDMGVLLDRLGIAVRTGHHCAQPLMRHYGVQGMVRASMALYNTTDEIRQFADAVRRVANMF